MHDVHHAIDLVTGYSLPNLHTYQMNLIEHAEFKRYVDGFFKRVLSKSALNFALFLSH